jgi:phasin family protein
MPATGFEQFAPLKLAGMESLIALGQSLMEQAEKMTRLQFDAGLESAREAMTATQAFFEVKDAAGLASWQTAYLQPNLERASDTARQQYGVLVETRGLLADALKQSATEATRQVQENIDRLVEGAPEGFEPLFDAIRTGLNAQLAAMESITRAGDQISEIAAADVQPPKAAVKAPVKPRAPAKRKTV